MGASAINKEIQETFSLIVPFEHLHRQQLLFQRFQYLRLHDQDLGEN